MFLLRKTCVWGLGIAVSLLAVEAQAQHGHGHSHGHGHAHVHYNHYDYHPTTVVDHGDHLHVSPGHYDYHVGSHYHPSYAHGHSYTVPTVALAPRPNYSGGLIEICSPPDTGAPVNYTLNGHDYTISPNQTQRIRHDRSWIVEFDRGVGYGVTRYTLTPGHYEFVSTDDGWNLVRAAKQKVSSVTRNLPPRPKVIPNPEPATVDVVDLPIVTTADP